MRYSICAFALIVCFQYAGTASTQPAATLSDSVRTTATAPGAHPALVPQARQAKAMERHHKFLARGKEGPIDLLFIGDSITERWETSGSKVWEKHYGDLNAAGFGIGGDRTQHVLWRIENGELDNISPKVVVLMIGTNNSNTDEPEPIIAGVTNIVEKIREKLPDTKILLLGIFPRAARRDLPENIPMQRVTAVNRAIAKLDDGNTVRFLDLGDKFLRDGKVPPEFMFDGVHLTEKGYEIWAESIDPLLKEMLGN
jgi:lysophospholipase L1-like esterase